jgi:raffinose/stachyose/melibiose transport system substrate-binding protein
MEITVDPNTTSRRAFLSLAMAAPIGAALAACGSSGPSTSTSSTGGAAKGGGASYWYLSGKPQEDVRKASVDRFNKANPGSQLKTNMYANDDYKTKVKTALGAGQAPTILWGWGGGGLKSWVDAGQVEDLTSFFSENAAAKDKIFPSAFGAATIGDKIYAIPTETVTPIIFYWNKQAFERIGAQPPQSWGDIMDLVPKFNAKNIAPFALAGQSRWTNMMWLEFMFDRIGGSEVFDAIFAGEKNAWSNPAAIEALTQVQNLVKANGFAKGFSSIAADNNADQALLYTGRAAMMVHGAWTYGSMRDQGGKFVSGGNLGYMNFPPVDGGKGDPSDTVGNPGQYLSISSKATDAEKEVAKKFFATEVNSDANQQDWVNNGSVPVVKGVDSKFGSAKDADWLKFNYDIASNAKVFAQSWDQALSPAAAEVLLDNIAKLFQTKVSPQQFADNMNKVIGQ